ncbi:hypothetical protein A2U01_0080170, partial [Trifolium medium]|nr:hypothetical protein [Trifolium medium]
EIKSVGTDKVFKVNGQRLKLLRPAQYPLRPAQLRTWGTRFGSAFCAQRSTFCAQRRSLFTGLTDG